MKSSVKDVKTVDTYPWIGISPFGIIVLFIAPCKGIQLAYDKYKLGEGLEVGEMSTDIIEEDFTYFKGEVTLSN